MGKIIDIIGKEIEIYKTKLLLFMTIAGGSWVYAVKFESNILAILLLLIFTISVIGIFINISKLSSLDEELKGLKDD